MFVPSETLDAVGMLDAETFAPVGYGADFDYGLRVRSAGDSVVVTRLSYLHHEKSVTATSMYGDGLAEYGTHGDSVMVAGMAAKWGDDWWRLAEIDPATKQTSPPGWRRRTRSGPLSVLNRISASRRRSRLSIDLVGDAPGGAEVGHRLPARLDFVIVDDQPSADREVVIEVLQRVHRRLVQVTVESDRPPRCDPATREGCRETSP